jgi:hypothetical protein
VTFLSGILGREYGEMRSTAAHAVGAGGSMVDLRGRRWESPEIGSCVRAKHWLDAWPVLRSSEVILNLLRCKQRYRSYFTPAGW